MVVAREVMLLELRRGLLLSSYQCIHVHVATNAGLHSLHTYMVTKSDTGLDTSRVPELTLKPRAGHHWSSGPAPAYMYHQSDPTATTVPAGGSAR